MSDESRPHSIQELAMSERTPRQILETGAAWITEYELRGLVERLEVMRRERDARYTREDMLAAHARAEAGWKAVSDLKEQLEAMSQAYREQRGMRETAEMRLAESVEQLEAAKEALRKCADDADATTAALYWAQEYGVDLNPASRPCKDCEGVGAQAGAHTERVEPCPTCGGSGRMNLSDELGGF